MSGDLAPVIRLGAASPGPALPAGAAPGQLWAPAVVPQPSALLSRSQAGTSEIQHRLTHASGQTPPRPRAPPTLLTHMLPFVLAASMFMLLFFHLFPGRAPFPLASLTLLVIICSATGGARRGVHAGLLGGNAAPDERHQEASGSHPTAGPSSERGLHSPSRWALASVFHGGTMPLPGCCPDAQQG